MGVIFFSITWFGHHAWGENHLVTCHKHSIVSEVWFNFTSFDFGVFLNLVQGKFLEFLESGL